MEKAREVLKDVFGFQSFRLSQEKAISRLIVDNENALVVFPTGGGKSLVYQVPGLCLDGLTLVISPLIALMKDQVDSLVSRGVNAASLDSTQPPERSKWIKAEVLAGKMKILYVAPERLNNEGFVNMMTQVKISLLAVDEAHCISQWGASFRPDYLKIARFAVELDVERVLCLTATATPSVSADICSSFLIAKEGVFSTPVFRPNLSLRIEVAETLDEKIDRVVPLLKTRTGPSIIYVTLQKQTEEVANYLMPHGIDAMVYHAGLPSDRREKIQTAFMESKDGVVVCTIAFGMGIDKADIRQVIHLYMPKSLENYSQEVGRAGRDGVTSTCVMFLSSLDIPTLEGFCRGDTCSKQDLELWLQEVATKVPAPDGTLDFNHYKQGKDYDIRANVLGLCYAHLELDHGYIRAITPFYSFYEITPLNSSRIFSDNSQIGKVIRTYWRRKSATGKHEIDIVDAASRAGVDRADMARHISNWELDGSAEVKASQVRARYTLLKPFEKTAASIRALADEMHTRMLKQEEDSVKKLRQVIAFAIDDDCLAHNLAKHFGNEDAVPNDMCGSCTFCTTGQSVEFTLKSPTVVHPKQIQAVLDACPIRDDPRLLARMAFGVTSPRLTANKWSTSHTLFGSMVNVDFGHLVQAFDAECKKVGYQSLEVTTATPSSSKKRSQSQISSNNSNTNRFNNRGRGDSKYKRGRWN